MNKDQKCCNKCYSTYTEHDYPAHTVHDACINRACECHQPPKWEEECNHEEITIVDNPHVQTYAICRSKCKNTFFPISKIPLITNLLKEEQQKKINWDKEGWQDEVDEAVRAERKALLQFILENGPKEADLPAVNDKANRSFKDAIDEAVTQGEAMGLNSGKRSWHTFIKDLLN